MAEESSGTTVRLIADEKDSTRDSDGERERDYVTGGEGRKDEVGYPHSVPEAFEKDQSWWGSE
jgi:hypothetical protein